jgi:hypothetical protein
MQRSLYTRLGRPAESSVPGTRTMITKAKETVDNDAEYLSLGEPYLSMPSAPSALRTEITRAKETVDNDQELFDASHLFL